MIRELVQSRFGCDNNRCIEFKMGDSCLLTSTHYNANNNYIVKQLNCKTMKSFLLDPVANDQLFLYSLSNPSPCKACGRNVHGQGVALIVICLVGVQLQFLSFPIFSFFSISVRLLYSEF